MLRNTLEGLEALAALAQFGTVSEAATRMRLTQSAVTKRIQALRSAVAFPLVERRGRRLVLTADALGFLERARPLIAELRALTAPPETQPRHAFSLAIADSIAASWGPAVLAAALREVPDVDVQVHAHRSVLLVENVRLGRYQIGITTDVASVRDLVSYPVAVEPMVIVGAGHARRPRSALPLITIEPTAVTWRAVEPLIRRHHPELLERSIVPVESFSAALQMVKAGFGDGLAPLGLTRETRVPRYAIRNLPHVVRHVTLLARKTTNQSQSFTRLRNAIAAAAAEHMRGLR